MNLHTALMQRKDTQVGMSHVSHFHKVSIIIIIIMSELFLSADPI